eukprot:10806087-Alexandrium_andersonii.AAC.1
MRAAPRLQAASGRPLQKARLRGCQLWRRPAAWPASQRTGQPAHDWPVWWTPEGRRPMRPAAPATVGQGQPAATSPCWGRARSARSALRKAGRGRPAQRPARLLGPCRAPTEPLSQCCWSASMQCSAVGQMTDQAAGPGAPSACGGQGRPATQGRACTRNGWTTDRQCPLALQWRC